MANRDIVVGGSAGSIDALLGFLPALPQDLQAAIFVVVHTGPESPGYLAGIFTRAGRLPARYARDGEKFAKGTIYVASPDHHLLLSPGERVQVVRGARENRTRPAIDPLFRSAALAYGGRVLGVLLSGGLDDGTAGVRGIKMCGGTTIVQDPADALAASMPSSALRNASVDYCKPSAELAALIVQLTQGEAPEPTRLENNMKRLMEIEVEAAKGKGGKAIIDHADPSLFTCPECHGALLRVRGESPGENGLERAGRTTRATTRQEGFWKLPD